MESKDEYPVAVPMNGARPGSDPLLDGLCMAGAATTVFEGTLKSFFDPASLDDKHSSHCPYSTCEGHLNM